MAVGDRDAEASRRLGDCIGRGDREGVEAFRAGELLDKPAQRSGRQKSSFS
jgi:hypothetical protein